MICKVFGDDNETGAGEFSKVSVLRKSSECCVTILSSDDHPTFLHSMFLLIVWDELRRKNRLLKIVRATKNKAPVQDTRHLCGLTTLHQNTLGPRRQRASHLPARLH